MSFNLENLIATPSIELLNLAEKTDLLDVADHYGLTSVKPSMLKHEINNFFIKFLVDEEILEPSAVSSILVTQTDIQLLEFEIQTQFQLEKLKLEQEERTQKEKLAMEKEKKIAIEKEKLEREERMQKE